MYWIRAFIRHSGLSRPLELEGSAVEAFLTWLAAERGVSVSAHRQAPSALLFLYTKVLGVRLPWMNGVGRPHEQRRLPLCWAQAKPRPSWAR